MFVWNSAAISNLGNIDLGFRCCIQEKAGNVCSVTIVIPPAFRIGPVPVFRAWHKVTTFCNPTRLDEPIDSSVSSIHPAIDDDHLDFLVEVRWKRPMQGFFETLNVMVGKSLQFAEENCSTTRGKSAKP